MVVTTIVHKFRAEMNTICNFWKKLLPPPPTCFKCVKFVEGPEPLWA
jgi:hypothetical protein